MFSLENNVIRASEKKLKLRKSRHKQGIYHNKQKVCNPSQSSWKPIKGKVCNKKEPNDRSILNKKETKWKTMNKGRKDTVQYKIKGRTYADTLHGLGIVNCITYLLPNTKPWLKIYA